MHRTYPLEFVKSIPGMGESDIQFALEHGLIDNHKEEKLAHLFPISRLSFDIWTQQHELWRAVALKWAIEHCSNTDRELFDEIDSIYADFDYPEDMKGIVSFMPGDENSNASTLRQKIMDFYHQITDALWP